MDCPESLGNDWMKKVSPGRRLHVYLCASRLQKENPGLKQVLAPNSTNDAKKVNLHD